MSFSALGLDAALVRSVKELGFTRQTPSQHDAIPPALAGFNMTLAGDGHELVYDYDTQAERTGVATLLGELSKAGVRIRDLQTTQSSLEEIFVDLVHEPRPQP